MFGSPETDGGNALSYMVGRSTQASVRSRIATRSSATRRARWSNKLAAFKQVEFDIMYGESVEDRRDCRSRRQGRRGREFGRVVSYIQAPRQGARTQSCLLTIGYGARDPRCAWNAAIAEILETLAHDLRRPDAEPSHVAVSVFRFATAGSCRFCFCGLLGMFHIGR